MKPRPIKPASLRRVLVKERHDFNEVADTKASGVATSLFYEEKCPSLVVRRHPTEGSHCPVNLIESPSKVPWNSGTRHRNHPFLGLIILPQLHLGNGQCDPSHPHHP